MILITGGTGFVGHHLAKLLRKGNKEVRCLVRSGESTYLSDLGVEVVKGDIFDPASLTAAMHGCDAVVHLVGVWRAKMSTYKKVHIQGTTNVIEATKQANIKRFIYTSGMGVSLNIATGFYQTKGESEELVKKSGLDYTIFRPAVIIGPGDEFTTALVDMVKQSPVVPVLGDGKVRLMPLFVEDLVDCLVKSLDKPEFSNKTYDIAGPDIMEYDQVMDTILEVLGLSKGKIHIPILMVYPMVMMGELFIPNLPISTDELRILQKDNVCDVSPTVKAFGLKQTSFKDALSTYLP